ncbi:MAG: hypothetical protein JWQ01_4837 [Massilia sp.]|nr:hypothetical protein [Massilia sp.]
MNAGAVNQAEDRNAKVRAVLLAATEPLGPSRIGELINEKWSCYRVSSAISRQGAAIGREGKSAAITPICRRIGAVGVKGKWSLAVKP